MNRSKTLILTGLLAGSLAIPGIIVAAEAKDGVENHGQHKGWEKDHSKKFDRSQHDRRDFGHNQRDLHRNGRWDDHRGRPVNYSRRHDGRFDNRGHHNKPEIRQDFKDIRATRKEVQQDRAELRKDYAELRKDRMELKRDLRNGAGKAEILKDRQEIRDDLKEIAKDRGELRADQGRLDAARQELKNDLRKR